MSSDITLDLYLQHRINTVECKTCGKTYVVGMYQFVPDAENDKVSLDLDCGHTLVDTFAGFCENVKEDRNIEIKDMAEYIAARDVAIKANDDFRKHQQQVTEEILKTQQGYRN